MRHLASLSSLRRLTFSYFFREFNGRFKDEGIEQIAALTNLEEFRVRRAAVRGHSLGPFRNLKSLDLTYCRLDDEGMRNIENMKALQKLWIGDTRVTDEGLAYVRDLHDIEELHLQGNQVSDAGLVHLEGLGQAQDAQSAERRHQRPRTATIGSADGTRGPQSLQHESIERRPGTALHA